MEGRRIILISTSRCAYCKLLKEHSLVRSNGISCVNVDLDPLTGKRPEAFHRLQQIIGEQIKTVPTLLIFNQSQVHTVRHYQHIKPMLDQIVARQQASVDEDQDPDLESESSPGFRSIRCSRSSVNECGDLAEKEAEYMRMRDQSFD